MYQSNPYDQTTPNWQAPPPPPSQRRSLKRWYSTKSKNAQAGIGCLVILGTLMLCGLCGTALNAVATSTNTPTPVVDATSTTNPNNGQLVQANSTSTTSQAQPTQAAAVPTTAPTKTQPTPTAKPQPTQSPTQPTPTPKPTCQAVNNNPWCYNFTPGHLITAPPSDFCSYFNCIPTFNAPDDPDGGYVVECQDGMYSQSGGESGSCSHHGGNLRPLYSH